MTFSVNENNQYGEPTIGDQEHTLGENFFLAGLTPPPTPTPTPTPTPSSGLSTTAIILILFTILLIIVAVLIIYLCYRKKKNQTENAEAIVYEGTNNSHLGTFINEPIDNTELLA